MDVPDKSFSELVEIVKSWIPRRTKPVNVSRDYWMPDQSCRVCYDCDSQFTVFNRRHHCRLCGRVFCAKCTANSIPTPSYEPETGREEWERLRVCNYCFKQWEQGIATIDNGIRASSPGLSPSPSATSLASTKSSSTGHSSSTVGSGPYPTGPYKRVAYISGLNLHQSTQMEPATDKQGMVASARNTDAVDVVNPSLNQFEYCMNRSDDDDDEFGVYRSDSETRHFPQTDEYYDPVDFDDISHVYGSLKVHPDGDNIVAKGLSSSPLNKSFDSHGLEVNKLEEEAEGRDYGNGSEATDNEPMDFENNGLLWLPPEPEDEEDEREAILFDDDEEDATGEWGYLRSSSSFGSGEYRSRDRSSEEHRKAMNNVVGGHFRALVAQLLQVENLPVGEDNGKESWLELITSLSWEAATVLKPDTSKGGGMDPGGYVKIKCIACGHRCESMVVKGVVCKKNVAHRRMISKIEKPRFLILGGALEYQRVSNLLSSFDTLLQQEKDHLKMAVAKIDAYHPNVLLVEKSVSRFAQDYLLAKDISLVLNIKRPLLERIARCTGAEIVPSIDHLLSQKLGYCELFHVEKFLEEHGSAGQGGKKLTKTLMFFEGCPKPLGCTILLKGANGDELKKVKHVVQYAVFAAYHLALETSFLADEGASLPELPLKSPITVALPDKPSSIERSISTIPGFTFPTTGKSQVPQPSHELHRSKSSCRSDLAPISNASRSKIDIALPTLSKGPGSQYRGSTSSFVNSSASFSSLPASEQVISGSSNNKLSPYNALEEKDKESFEESFGAKTFDVNYGQIAGDHFSANDFGASEALGPHIVVNNILVDRVANDVNQLGNLELASLQQGTKHYFEEPGSSKEEFPPSPSDHQSILVSLSTRCVWKGTVCERSHLFRIKYYGSFDKPLGRFLRDHLFDQSYRCRSCEMLSEAHVHCYTHRQGSLTISVKKLPEFLLPGEREGKIWMWHRCLRCPRKNGFPPATQRVVMSDAAWGLSFGKFLELSFSNHAAASRVASCGHSLHRDCLRFYGFGRMVACFRYASIDVHSVYLPPPKLDFNYEIQDWIQKEVDGVVDRAEVLFTKVLDSLRQIAEKRSGTVSPNSGMTAPESKRRITELEGRLQKEKVEFEESLQKALKREPKKGQPVIDIIEINQLRRQLLFQSFMWDHLLIHAASLDNNCLQVGLNSSIWNVKERPHSSIEKLIEMDATSKPSKSFSSCDSFLMDNKPEKGSNQGGQIDDCTKQPSLVHQGREMDQEPSNEKEAHSYHSANRNLGDHSDSLESVVVVRRALSEGQFPIMENLSDTLDAAWTGENHPGSVTPKENGFAFPDTAITDSTVVEAVAPRSDLEDHVENHCGAELVQSRGHGLTTKGPDNMAESMSWVGMPFINFYHLVNKNSAGSPQKLDMLAEYNPASISSFQELKYQGGARLLLPLGVNDTFFPVYDDEPTSIISYALVSSDYHVQMSDEQDRSKDGLESSVSLPLSDSVNHHSLDETASEAFRSLRSTDESILSMSVSRSSLALDPLLYTKALHVKVSFTNEGPLGKVKYTVTCYYAKRFEALRRICCSSKLDFVRSLSRCKKWGAQGGKSNVFFAKTLDDRFIIKQVTKTELESFIKFAPDYFKYLSESIGTGCPTCLAKILGIYQVTSKHLKGGKESRLDVLVMENLLFRRNVTRLYDLKGSSRSRYNPDSSGNNKVLLDQNLIEAMPTSPIFVGNKAKRLLERAVWNDTSFLASIDVMDYSLLVGVDEVKHELVLGIIDFMRQYTWDKHLETWVKASGILGGLKNSSPTVISPKQYKKRFRKAMSAYFLMVPDQWSPSTIIPSGSQSDLGEGGTALD